MATVDIPIAGARVVEAGEVQVPVVVVPGTPAVATALMDMVSCFACQYRITYNSWHSRPIFRHHQNTWSHIGPKLDLKQACFLIIPQYSFLHPCAPSY